jgi:hypothetical protein
MATVIVNPDQRRHILSATRYDVILLGHVSPPDNEDDVPCVQRVARFHQLSLLDAKLFPRNTAAGRGRRSQERWHEIQDIGERMIRNVAAWCLAMSISSSSFAMEVTLDGYQEYMNKGETERSIILFWLDGVYRGFDWANAILRSENVNPFFCPPEKMEVTREQIKSILDQYIKTHELRGGDHIGLTFLFALEDEFPCRWLSVGKLTYVSAALREAGLGAIGSRPEKPRPGL